MSVEILPIHTPALFEVAVARACAALRAGEVVALPTETVYGLAANAYDARAVARIFEIKGRPATNPLIVHVADGNGAIQCAREWPEMATRLAARFWPGPLTLVVPRSDRIPDIVTAGGETVGVRWPFHPLMQAVIRACGFPLAAPSANLSNQLSPTSAAHVAAGLGERIQLIVDGGDCNVGIESTVVDVTGAAPRVLRPGIIGADEIESVAGVRLLERNLPAGAVLRSPGMLARHYCPKARLLIRGWRDDAELDRLVAAESISTDGLWIIAHRALPMSGRFPNAIMIPSEPEAYARALYGELHRCDEAGARCILVEAVPEGPAWDGIADRLGRAAAGSDHLGLKT